MAFKESNIIGPASYNITGTADTSVGTGTNTGTVTIGNTNSGLISINCSTSGITVGTTSNAHTSTLGSTDTTSSTTVQAGTGGLSVTATGGSLTINSGTGTIGFSTDSSATTVNVGTGSAAKTITLGSTNTTSTTNIDTGSGGVNIPAFSAGAVVTSTSGVLSSVNGTATDVLTANTGAAPSFQPLSAPGAGGLVLLSAVNFTTNTTNIDFDNTLITSTYKKYMILIDDLPQVSQAGTILIKLSTDNGSTFLSTQGVSKALRFGSSSFNAIGNNFTESPVIAMPAATLYIQNVGSSGFPVITGNCVYEGPGAGGSSYIRKFYRTSAVTVNFLRLTSTGAQFSRGNVYLYGIVNS